MQIVVLDGHTLNPGDLSWDELRALGDCQIHDRTPQREIVARAKDAQVVLTNKTVLSRETIAQLPQLKFIAVLATGYNVVDTAAASEQGIAVANIPIYGTQSVAQMVFAHLLNLTQHVGHHARTVRDGRWTKSEDFCYWDYPLVELAGETMGIVGLGRIGRATAHVAQALGMKVAAYDVATPATVPDGLKVVPDGVEMVDLTRLFGQSDVVSLHCPLTPQTERLVDADRLALMKPSAFLINTSRGPLIDEAALAEALNGDRLAGGGIDVLSTEPPPADNPLLSAKNCFVTPHIAWATKAARTRLLKTAIENVRAFLDGSPTNVVNAEELRR